MNRSTNKSFLYDAHAHVHLCTKPSKVLEAFHRAGGRLLVNVLSDFKKIVAFKKVIELSHSLGLYTAPVVGIHPALVKFSSINATKALFETIVTDEVSVKAVGEVGLDTYYDSDLQLFKLQKQILDYSFEFASARGLSVVLHIRGKGDYESLVKTAIDVAKSFPVKVYFHSFVGTLDLAKKILDIGGFIGINGIVTYTSAKHLIDVILNVPLDRIFLETDSPYLIPSNMPRELLIVPNENMPLGVVYVARFIAKKRKVSLNQVISSAFANVLEFFDIK